MRPSLLSVGAFALVTLVGCQIQRAQEASNEDDCAVDKVATSSEIHGLDLPTDAIGKEIRWYRNSAERPLLYAQAYQLACRAVSRKAQSLTDASWAVIIDADETVLDNSEFQAGLAVSREPYSDAAWEQWVKERRASLLPGAKAFIDRVRLLGGSVFIVTNRADNLCEDTRANLAALSVTVTSVVCKTSAPDKNIRFKEIRDGRYSGGQPMNVIAYVGDNVLDFPDHDQASRAGAQFGTDFFLLPNPMYGSFEAVPFR